MNLLSVIGLINIACFTIELANAKRMRKRVNALETTVNKLSNGLESMLESGKAIGANLQEIHDTVDKVKRGICPRSDLPKNCIDVALQTETRTSGYYAIYPNEGDGIEVYCDFYGTRGYMFLSKTALSTLNTTDGLYTLHDHAIIRVLYANGEQHDVTVSQIPLYHQRFALSFQINKADGYPLPFNNAMKPYLYLGFIPKDIGKLKTKEGKNAIQGYRAGVHDVEFKNCDQNPNSYIAFFGNDESVEEDPYWKGFKSVCVIPGRNPRRPGFSRRSSNIFYDSPNNNNMKAWFTNDEIIPTNRYLRPQDFFFYEMHMGGCGGYFTSSHGVNYGVRAATLGLGFDIKPRC